jgi:DNA polymerase-3 subunit gamma/tau
MVTQQGFNALLKIVEEPPEHVKFIFATTEPEKVIGTIRSRTHHYPFRLVPPAVMLDYVTELCVQEKVTIEDGVLPLVIRAGGGSVRDTLSLLDQIIAGSDDNTVNRVRTNNLLGYTPSELLDESIEAIGRGEAAHAFGAIDRVVQTGNDPRRFVEDVLERLRDLIIINATGDGAAAVLRGIPADEITRMNGLAALYGSAALSRAADIVNAALSGMTGTTPPRIHLELMVARLLTELPDQNNSQSAPVTDAAPVTPAVPAAIVAEPDVLKPVASVSTPVNVTAPVASTVEPGTLAELLDVWPAILEELESSKGSWVVVNSARAALLEGDVLTLEFSEQMWVDRFKENPTSGNAVFEDLREAIQGALGVRLRFVPRLGITVGLSSTAPAKTVTPVMVDTPATDAEAPDDDAPTTKMEPVESPKLATSAPSETEHVAVESDAPESAERRGESVIREMLGATLIANIDDAGTPNARSVPADDTPAIFDIDPTPREGNN